MGETKHEVKIRSIAGSAESLCLECSCGQRDFFGTAIGETAAATRARADRYAARHVAERESKNVRT